MAGTLAGDGQAMQLPRQSHREIANIDDFLHLAQGFTMHGLALNLDPDLSAYGWFTPCGVAPQEGAVSSVARLMGQAPRPEAAAAQLGPRLSRAVSDLPSLLHLTPPEGNIKPDGPAGA